MIFTIRGVKVVAKWSPLSPEHLDRLAVLARRAIEDDNRQVPSRAQMRTTVLPSVCPGVWSHKRKLTLQKPLASHEI